jgi:hypothetical protein
LTLLGEAKEQTRGREDEKTFHGMEAGEGTNHKSPSLSTARSLTSESREEEEKQLEPRASGDGD